MFFILFPILSYLLIHTHMYIYIYSGPFIHMFHIVFHFGIVIHMSSCLFLSIYIYSYLFTRIHFSYCILLGLFTKECFSDVSICSYIYPHICFILFIFRKSEMPPQTVQKPTDPQAWSIVLCVCFRVAHVVRSFVPSSPRLGEAYWANPAHGEKSPTNLERVWSGPVH
jgi:hypothetical protein